MKYLCKVVFFAFFIFFPTLGFCNIYHNAWIDIPKEYFLPKELSENKYLINLVNKYHSIEKKDVNLLQKRISLLNLIKKEIKKNFCNKTDLIISLEHLYDMVLKKLWYLEEIYIIYKTPLPYKKFVDTPLIEKKFTPIFLSNQLSFDIKLPAYWGYSLLEAIDPCHRFLTGYYLHWKKDSQNIPFFLWLEDQEIPYYTTQIKYLHNYELLKNCLEIHNGKLVHSINKQNANFNDKEKEYIFIITIEKTIIVVESSKNIRHTSISHGRPVLGSGALKINDGNLIYIDTESGHYQPTPECLLQAIKFLEENGAKLDFNMINVKYYFNNHIINESAKDFFKKFKYNTTILNSKIELINFRI